MESLARPWLLTALPVIAAGILLVERRYEGAGLPARVARVALRLAIAAALVLAAAGPRGAGARTPAPVVFAVDVSASMGDLSPLGEELASLLDALPAGTPRAALAFGAGHRICLSFDQSADSLSFDRAASAVDRSATDVRRGLAAALGMLPGAAGGAVVLVSDGRARQGDAAAAAAECASRNVALFTLAFPRVDAADVWLERFNAPTSVDHGRPILLTAVASSTTPRRASVTVRVDPDGPVVGRSAIALVPEVHSRIAFTHTPQETGIVSYVAEVRSAEGGNANPHNDSARAAVLVRGEPSVLVVSRDESSVAPLLRRAGDKFAVRTARAAEFVASSRALATHSAVVLDNVARADLSATAEAAILGYVREGGGLLATGGPHAFGAGGWRDADPLASVLPVKMDPGPTDRVFLILLVDASGSMAMEGSPGNTKIEDARSAVSAIVPELGPDDQVALVGFRDAANLILPPTPAFNRDTILDSLLELKADGKTSLTAPLEFGAAMAREKTSVKPVAVMLSDGEPTIAVSAREITDAARRLHDARATLHVLGTNPLPAHRKLLAAAAEAGGGEAIFEADYTRVSDALRNTVLKATGRYARFGVVKPVPTAGGRAVLGEVGDLPVLAAQNRTELQQGATQTIGTAAGAPLAAAIPVGPGRSAAFTSMFGGSWSGAFGSWPGRLPLLLQFLRSVSPPPPSTGFELAITRNGDGTFIEVMATADENTSQQHTNLLPLEIAMWRVGTGAPPVRIPLEQVGLGRYRARLGPSLARHTATLHTRLFERSDAGIRTELLRLPLVPPPSDELRGGGVDRRLLNDMARLSGGRLLTDGERLSTALANATRVAGADVAPAFAAAALALVMLEVLARFFYARRKR